MDAFSKGLGAILSQDANGEEHPMAFFSRKLTATEKNYAIVEQECLAIKWVLNFLCYFLLERKLFFHVGPCPTDQDEID